MSLLLCVSIVKDGIMKKLLFLVALIAFASCSKMVKYTISGSSKDFVDGKWAYLCIVDETMNLVVSDSVEVVNNTFSFKGECERALPASITVGDYELDDNIMISFIVESGHIIIGDMDANCHYHTATGTPLNDKHSEFSRLVKPIETNPQTTVEELLDFVKPHILENIDNALGGFLFDRYFWSMSNEMRTEIIDAMPSQKREVYVAWMKELETRLQAINEREEQTNNLVGKSYINMEGQTPSGEELSLQSVVADKSNRFVLLEFWASWCGPCLNEVLHLKEAYNKYADKGFEIFAVSFDDKEDEWTAAINSNELKWLHTLNKGDIAEKQYGVYSIPANFLIECETGAIGARNLRGYALDEKLSELIK